MASNTGVMPLAGGDNPWKWAEAEARNNDELFKMFIDKQRRAEEETVKYNRGLYDTEQANTVADARIDRQNAFTLQRDGANADLQREISNMRYGGRDDQDLLAAHRAQFREIERAKGLPEGFLDAFAEIESGSGRNTKAKGSSASGVFQFIKGTGEEMGLTNPHDPVASGIATADYAKKNAQLWQGTFRNAPTARDMYLMHQQGPGGGIKLAQNPNAAAASIVGLEAVLNNGGTANMSAGQFSDLIRRKYDNADNMWKSRRGAATTQAPPQEAPQAAAANTGTPATPAPATTSTASAAAPAANVHPTLGPYTIIKQIGDIAEVQLASGKKTHIRVK